VDIDDERLLVGTRTNIFSMLNPEGGEVRRVARLLDRHRLIVGIREPSREVSSEKAVSAVVRFFRG
jgi:hypothetical protein